MRRGTWLLGLGLVWGASPSAADVVHLRSGASQECVLIEITDEWVRYETPIGRAALPRSKVVGVTQDPDATNQTLRKRWQAERAAEQARARARERQVEVERLTQEALGNVQYEGEWVSAAERDARVAAKQAAQEAAHALDRAEAQAGHIFYYEVWLTPATHTAILGEEEQLRTHQARLGELQEEINLLNERIETARQMGLQEKDLDTMEKRGKQIEELRGQVEATRKEAAEVQTEGDAVAARITALVERARARLARILTEQGHGADAVAYLKGPS